MATVSIIGSPHNLSAMSTRRVPLLNNPNAANSPYRATAPVTKQKRSYATVQREETYGHPPPAKKQMVRVNQISLKTPTRQPPVNTADGRVFTRKSNAAPPNTFTRQLEAARVRNSQQPHVTADNEVSEKNLETIRQWQRHYRRVFPKLVFYFESISEDQRIKFSKQITTLGAREEKFFSNAVTHVVTSRPIPPELDAAGKYDNSSCTKESQGRGAASQTINPLLLDRSSEPSAQLELRPLRGKFTFEAPVGKKVNSISQDVDVRKQQGRNADVLHRARALGMKIWALEKLERMMVTMFETDTGMQVSHSHNTRSNIVQSGTIAMPRSARQADLSQLLRNERINGPSDRDPTVAMKEIVMFKGPYIYIRDIDEKQKPIMVREYAKVSDKEDGDWPQFRSVSNGRCPFVEEVEYEPRDAQRELAKQQKRREREDLAAPRVGGTVEEPSRMQPPKASTSKKALATLENVENRGAKTTTVTQPALYEMAAPSMEPEHSSKGPQNAFISRAGPGRLVGGEPVASGVQPSNITSAIRSQMISSTASAPGAKAGTSKEVHGLQRKVLERNSGSASLGQASSHRMTDYHAVVKEDTVSKGSKRRTKEKLELIEEDVSSKETKLAPQAEVPPRGQVKGVEKKKVEKRDGGKLGYCENCMETFSDFNEHALSRKHRKFAENNDNWHELDALLELLSRPFRDDYC